MAIRPVVGDLSGPDRHNRTDGVFLNDPVGCFVTERRGGGSAVIDRDHRPGALPDRFTDVYAKVLSALPVDQGFAEIVRY